MKACALQYASTDTTFLHNTPLPYPQHSAAPYPHMRAETTLNQTELQLGEEPILLRTVSS